MHHRGREVLGNAIYDNILSQRVHARSTGRPEEIARQLSSCAQTMRATSRAPLWLSDFSIDRYRRNHLACGRILKVSLFRTHCRLSGCGPDRSMRIPADRQVESNSIRGERVFSVG
jgi:hypothetical protein